MEANINMVKSRFPLVGLFVLVLKLLVLFAINICIVRPDNHQITGFIPSPKESSSEQIL